MKKPKNLILPFITIGIHTYTLTKRKWKSQEKKNNSKNRKLAYKKRRKWDLSKYNQIATKKKHLEKKYSIWHEEQTEDVEKRLNLFGKNDGLFNNVLFEFDLMWNTLLFEGILSFFKRLIQFIVWKSEWWRTKEKIWKDKLKKQLNKYMVSKCVIVI